MEKPIADLSLFENYRNRQVILNYYQEDILSQRDGFAFISLKVSKDELIFSKKDNEVFTVPITNFPKRLKNDEFQDYYIFRNPEINEYLEIYFS